MGMWAERSRLIGIDVGTGGVRALLVDAEGYQLRPVIMCEEGRSARDAAQSAYWTASSLSMMPSRMWIMRLACIAISCS